MVTSKKLITFTIGLLILLLGGISLVFTLVPEKMVPFMIERQIARQLEQSEKGQALLNDKEGITVFTVGTASPIPGERVQTGTAVIVNGHFFMFDVGDGVVQKAENLGLPLNGLDGIFITHWHSDHFMDLASLVSRSWLLGRSNELHLYGPDGTDTINQAIRQYLLFENEHRVAHHGSEVMDASIVHPIPHEFKNVRGGKEIVYQQDGITVTAFDVNHAPIEPAVGYVLSYNGRKIVISGDTKKNELVLEMAENADLLLHEVILISLLDKMSEKLAERGDLRSAKILTDIQDYHTSPAEVAALAAEAKVKRLVLHHFAPAPDMQIIKNLYKREMSAFSGPIHFANDGDRFVVK